MVIAVCYRHPKKTSDNAFNNKLNDILEEIKKENKIFIICGNFNYNLLRYESDRFIYDFIHMMFANSFQPCSIQLTRHVENSKLSLIDNIFINSIEEKS